MGRSAIVLRISPSGIDKVPEALASNQLIIGWARAKGLDDPSLSWQAFRQVLHETYYASEPTLHRAGSAAGHMWRFLRDLKEDDLVVVPYWSDFYVARVIGPARHLAEFVDDDTAYRRPVEWLNGRQKIPRSVARSALISRMKAYGTTADATDLVGEIEGCLALSSSEARPTFERDLKARLVRETLAEIRSGRMDSFGFESLIRDVLLGLGAVEARIVPRSVDKGADVVATFRVAGTFQQVVAVQAKHWQPEPPVDASVVEQLIRGIVAEGADLGMVVTSGTIAESARLAAQKYFDEEGKRIELIDGEQFAALIVEHGVRGT